MPRRRFGRRGFCRTEATEITEKCNDVEASDRQNPKARYARENLKKRHSYKKYHSRSE